MSKFDHFPLIEGASVPLRRHIATPDGNDVLAFSIAHGDGEVDGVPFTVDGSTGIDIEVRFNPNGSEFGEYRYTIKARDLIEIANEQFKKDRLAK